MTDNYEIVIGEHFNDGTFVEHYFNTAEYIRLRQVIERKDAQYITKYNSTPKYVKLPKWLVKAIEAYYGNRPFLTIADLIICPTDSIHEIEEIEVF